jgi:hypothetical protein
VGGEHKSILTAGETAKESFLMKTKRFFLFGLPAVLLAVSASLALGLVLAGCGGDDDDGGGLPGIDEPTTGQAEVKGTGISVSGEDMIQELGSQTNSYNGSTFFIAGGKFSFTLSTPSNPQTLGSNGYLRRTLFGDEGVPDYTATPDDATFAIVSEFSWDGNENTWCRIIRGKVDTDNKTYLNSSEIVYVYASEDVTLSHAKNDWTKSGEGMTRNYHWGAVNLPLKTGWNLVQIDSNATADESTSTYTMTGTVKIATDDVPWAYETGKKDGN